MNWTCINTTGILPPAFAAHTTTAVGCKLFVFGASYDQLVEEMALMGKTSTLNGESPSSSTSSPSSTASTSQSNQSSEKTQSQNTISELFIYDTQTSEWIRPQVSGDIPPPHTAHSACLVGDKIFVFGGGRVEVKEGKAQTAYYQSVYELCTITMHWSLVKTTGDQPPARRAHSATAVDSRIYVFGGGNGKTAFNDVWCLDTEKLSWSLIQSKGAPYGRGYHTATRVGKKIFIFGGSDTKDCFSDMAVLDTSNHSWSRKKVPYAKNVQRYAHSTTLVGNWLFIMCGCNGKEYLNDIACLDIKTMKWKNIFISGNPPASRGYHTATLHDNRIFLLGGSNHEQIHDSMFILDLGCYAFLCASK